MYNGMGNDPVNVTDPTGGKPFDWGKGLNADGLEVIRHFDGAVPDGWVTILYGHVFKEAGTNNWFRCGSNGRFQPVGGPNPTLTLPGSVTMKITPAEMGQIGPIAPSFSEARPMPSGFIPDHILFPAPLIPKPLSLSYLNVTPIPGMYRTEAQLKSIAETMDKMALEERRARWDAESPMGQVPLLGNVGNMFYRWRQGDISGGLGYGGWSMVDAASMGVTGLARKGVTTMVSLTEETFTQALYRGAENVAGYSVYGTKGLVGSTFNRNIFLIDIPKELRGLARFRSFVGRLESEALRAGANKISIYGSSVINDGFLNPAIIRRFGYSFEQSGSGVILQKILK
jgi:hypothetical protein